MTTIDHVALYVQNPEQARAFFEHYFGAQAGEPYHNARTGLRSCFLSFGRGCRLELMHRPQMDDATKSLTRTGYSHVALSVGSREKVDALTAQLAADGHTVLSGPRTTGDGYYESCVQVFEGNLIEITV